MSWSGREGPVSVFVEHGECFRRHGVFVWGETWERAKIQAEAYDDIFDLAVKMRKSGFDPEHMNI